jgi:hypothetical protein
VSDIGRDEAPVRVGRDEPALTAGHRHESPQAIPLLEQGLERLLPDAVVGDKG